MNNIVNKFLTVWLRPSVALGQVRDEQTPDVKSSMIFILAMGVLSGIITVIVGLIHPETVAGAGASKIMIWVSGLIVPVVSFLGSFVGALLIWAIVDGLLEGTATEYWKTYTFLALLAAFSPVSALMTIVPKVGQYLAIAVNVWATIILIRGIIIVRGTPVVRTWITCVILFVLLFALGVAMRVAATQQAAGNFGDLGAANDFGGDDVATDEELDKQLKDLAEKAETGQAGQTTPPAQSKQQ